LKPETIRHDALASPLVRSNIAEQVFVWGIWLIMLGAALFYIVKYRSNIPVWEDWFLVSPLTGNEPDLLKWLWAQNNEHRIPLPRLILLGLLKIANGDFRIGMLFNVISLGVISLAMILVARKLRSDRTSFTDAFFPIALLHLGNWENLFWSWQITFVIPAALTFALLLVFVGYTTLVTPAAAVISGTCLMLLPLCGANGLLIVPLIALWLIYSGALHRQAIKLNGRHEWIGIFLIASSTIALILSGLYFVGYEHVTWYSPSPNFLTTLDTAAKLLAFGFGSTAERSWTLSEIFTVSFLLFSGGVAVLGVLHSKGLERHRSMGVLLFFGNLIMFALIFGWGRAVSVQQDDYLPLRYPLLGVQALCTAYFIWQLYGSPKLRRVAQAILFFAMLISIPYNTKLGLTLGDWYKENMEAFEKDLSAGIPPSILVERHKANLIFWWDETQLTNAMQMLHDAGIEPFSRIKVDATER
jgi:hypothetical protein